MSAPPGPLAVVGASGHGLSVLDAALAAGFDVAGFVDDAREPGALAHGLPVLGGVEALVRGQLAVAAVVVAVGHNDARRRVVQRLRGAARALSLPAVVHPSAVVSPRAHVEGAAFVGAAAVLGPDARVGEGAIVNTAASVDHGCLLGAWSSLAPRVVLGGDVRVGEGAAVGIGASVLHGRVVGEHAVVGAGAVVLRDAPPHAVSLGVPARVVRGRAPHDAYL